MAIDLCIQSIIEFSVAVISHIKREIRFESEILIIYDNLSTFLFQGGGTFIFKMLQKQKFLNPNLQISALHRCINGTFHEIKMFQITFQFQL